ncbi:MAG TPA: hypothetical protein VKV15_18185 [Bryobacteraceae bacterium]|nr:hypothetical protein [Bryobacteraceae bacterium]
MLAELLEAMALANFLLPLRKPAEWGRGSVTFLPAARQVSPNWDRV